MKTLPPLLNGEKPIDQASSVTLRNGEQCIPQHYLVFAHDRESVEEIVVNIDFDDKYLIFICEDNSGVYIQIGIVGFDNYIAVDDQEDKKVVYGRKWRVEAQLPSSEIIQTVFLAIKTAREHEVRELLQLKENNRTTTPFNNHHDLPLMAQNSGLVTAELLTPLAQLDRQRIQKYLDKLVYDDSLFDCKTLRKIGENSCLCEVQITEGIRSQLPEIHDRTVFLVLSEPTVNELHFQLMETLIGESNRYVEENFTYLGFARFSRNNNIHAIADLSFTLRQKEVEYKQNKFSATLEENNYQTDKTRVPILKSGPQTNKLKNRLTLFGKLNGILPSY
ncbi:MAG: hypothetical protein L3J46_08025 [Kangiellaceae bacterium]|nr:hypothetical protein [Kangiellaceae bacterium]